jgi:phosphotransferase system HPr-like phosphotransfer protein
LDVPWEEDTPEEVTTAPQGDYDAGWATELAKTACYAMKEGKSFTASIIFATASHAVDYNDQLTIHGDTADMEVLSLEIGNAIQSECRETAVLAFDEESIPVSEQL